VTKKEGSNKYISKKILNTVVAGRTVQLCFRNRRANLGGLANSWTRTAL